MLLEAANRREEVFIKKTRGDFCSNYSVLTNPTTTLRNRQRMNVMGGGKRKRKRTGKKGIISRRRSSKKLWRAKAREIPRQVSKAKEEEEERKNGRFREVERRK